MFHITGLERAWVNDDFFISFFIFGWIVSLSPQNSFSYDNQLFVFLIQPFLCFLFLSLALSSVFSTAHHGSLSYLIKSELKQNISRHGDTQRPALITSTLNPEHVKCRVVLVSITQLNWRRCDRLHAQSAGRVLSCTFIRACNPSRWLSESPNKSND